jgi:hypothetical protein
MAEEDNSIPLEHLTDRELLLIAVRTLNDHSRTTRDHERRINVLENWRSGIVAIGGFIVAVLGLKHSK